MSTGVNDDIAQEAVSYYTHRYVEAQAWAEAQPDHLSDLIDVVTGCLEKYVQFAHPSTASVVALWIVQTYCFKRFYYCGYLSIRSDQPGSGKTVLLEVLSALSKGNPELTVSPTEALLFRSRREVWLIDEVDNLRDQDADMHGRLMGVLNSGFKQSGSVSRMAKQGDRGYTEQSFSTYSPKAFAGLKKLADTVSDRCFHITMTKSAKRRVRLTGAWLRGAASKLRKRLEDWMSLESLAILTKEYEKVSSLEGLDRLQRYDARFQDIAEPLFVIAQLADCEAGREPRITASLIAGLPHVAGNRKPSDEQVPLVIRELEATILGKEKDVFIPSQTVLEILRAAGVWWVDSTKAVASFFKTVGLSPRSTGSIHGYDFTRDWFQSLDSSIRQGSTPLLERVSDT